MPTMPELREASLEQLILTNFASALEKLNEEALRVKAASSLVILLPPERWEEAIDWAVDRSTAAILEAVEHLARTDEFPPHA